MQVNRCKVVKYTRLSWLPFCSCAKHYNQGDLEKKDFVLAYGSRELASIMIDSSQGNWSRKLRAMPPAPHWGSLGRALPLSHTQPLTGGSRSCTVELHFEAVSHSVPPG